MTGALARKALYVGVSALELDLLLASAWPLAQAACFQLTALRRTIVRISHLLRQAHTLAEMGSLLLSHLDEELATEDQRRALECELPRPFLAAWHPFPHCMPSEYQRPPPDWVYNCAISGNGRVIVSASADGTVKVWDTATGVECLTLSGHHNAVLGIVSCAISGDGNLIVSASWDGTLRVWDTASGAERLTLSGHTGTVNGCAVSPDSCFIVSASDDGTLKVWDAVSGACIFTFPVGRELHGYAFHPDGEHLVTCGKLGMFFLRLAR